MGVFFDGVFGFGYLVFLRRCVRVYIEFVSFSRL